MTHSQTYARIVRNPKILGSEPVVARTRIPVRTIVQYARIYNYNLTEMERIYPSLSRAEVKEALAFYEANHEEMDRHIAENEDDNTSSRPKEALIW